MKSNGEMLTDRLQGVCIQMFMCLINYRLVMVSVLILLAFGRSCPFPVMDLTVIFLHRQSFSK